MYSSRFLYFHTSKILKYHLFFIKYSEICFFRVTLTLKLLVPVRTDFSSSCHCTGFFVFVSFFFLSKSSFFLWPKLNVRFNRSIGLNFFGGVKHLSCSSISKNAKTRQILLEFQMNYLLLFMQDCTLVGPYLFTRVSILWERK